MLSRALSFRRVLAALLLLYPAVTPAQPGARNALSLQTQWIWYDATPEARNVYGYFRKTVELPATPTEALAWVCADSRYVLYVNGTYVGRGPARSDPRWQQVDRLDLTPYLHRGRNILAAAVTHFGVSTAFYALGRPGFLLQCEVRYGEHDSVPIRTDTSWKALRAWAWNPDAPRMGDQIAFAEVFDARQEPAGWPSAACDDAAWPAATVVGTPPCDPWPTLVPRSIPQLREHPIAPERLVATGDLGDVASRYHVLDLAALYHTGEPGVAYCTTSIWSDREREWEVRIGSDDQSRVWLNGAELMARNAGGAARPDQASATGHVRQGWNRVLAKVVNSGGPWGFLFRLAGDGSETARCSATEQNGGPEWLTVAPFDNPNGKGFDTVYPPETALDLHATYTGKAGATVRWQPVPDAHPTVHEVARLMTFAPRLPLHSSRIQHPQALLHAGGRTLIQTRGDTGATLVLDFGREISGYPRLEIAHAHGGEVFDLGYSEVLENGEVHPDRDGVMYADRYVARPGRQTYQVFDRRAFRYLRLDVHGATAPVAITRVDCVESLYPVESRGVFACSDPTLNKIWEISARTVALNMEDGYTDCPWRERGQWWGDARVEALNNYTAFGDAALVRQGLYQVAQSQRPDGLTLAFAPTGYDAVIPDYALIWVVSLWDYYLWTGDAKPLRDLYPAVDPILAFFRQRENAAGLAADVPFWVFIDWAPVDKSGANGALNAFYVRALQCAGAIADVVGQPEDARRYAAHAERVAEGFRQYLWDPARKLFRDGRSDDHPSTAFSQHANVLAVAYDIVPSASQEAILDTGLTDPSVVSVGSPFFSFYVLDALDHRGRQRQLVEYIRRLWGRMLERDATTTWELWSGEASQCHGWSGAPAHWLPVTVLGVRPAQPGFAEVAVRPSFELLDWAEGRVPTPQGEIAVEWRKDRRGRVRYALTLPADLVAHVALPCDPAQAQAIRVRTHGQILSREQQGDRLVITLRGQGRHVFTIPGALTP